MACTIYPRREPGGKHGRAMTSCPVIPTLWIISRTFCGSVAKLASPWRRPTRLHRSRLGFRRAEREALGHARPASLSMSRRSRSKGSATIASCGAQRPTTVRQVRCGSSGIRINPAGESCGPAIDLRTGLIEGSWTRRPPSRPRGWRRIDLKGGRRTLCPVRNTTPSQSTLDRLPKALRVPWEAQRPRCEAR